MRMNIRIRSGAGEINIYLGTGTELDSRLLAVHPSLKERNNLR